MLRAFRGAPSGVAALVALLLLITIALLAPIFLTPTATALDFTQANLGPSQLHPLGTDELGRDLLARLLVATRLSLGLAFMAVGISACIGISFGALAGGVLTGRGRSVALRAIDLGQAFPGLIVAIYVVTALGPGLFSPAVGIGLAGSFGYSRVTSALAMSIGGRDFVSAARLLGLGWPRLLYRHVLPNIAETLLIATTVGMSGAIVATSSLSFLGIGVQPPNFDWGQLLTSGVANIYARPTGALGPAIAVAVSSLAFGFSGEALARAANPLLWGAGTEKRRVATVEMDGHAVPVPTVRATPTSDADGHALVVRDLSVTFPTPRGPVRAVSDVSFSLRKGERLGIVGESGSGKTTMALAIAQLIPYPGRMEGTITFAGSDLRSLMQADLDRLLGTKLAVVYQDPMSSMNPAVAVGTQLTEAVEQHRRLDHRAATTLAVDRLAEVNLPDPAGQLARHPHEFSGGMRQRVMIAMGLMNEPELLLADEPTTALDVTIQAQLMDLLEKLNAEHQTALILISHNLALVRQACERVLVMYGGRVVEDLPTDRLATDARHPYTRALLGAVPDLSQPRDARFASIPGQAADVADLPPGCAYHPRCRLAVDRCKVDVPPLLTRPDGSRVACWVANQDLG